MNIENKTKIIEDMKNTIREQQNKIERYEKALKTLQNGNEMTYKIVTEALNG